MADIAKEIESKDASETRSADVSFTGLLEASEILTGTPTCSSSPAGLTFASVAYNSSTIVIAGESVTANRGLSFLVSGGTAGVLYTITCTAPTTDGGQVDVQRECLLEVT